MTVMEFAVLVFVAVTCLEAAKLPSFIKPCSLSDPNFVECTLTHGQDALPFIVKGDNKYKIPSMVPLKIPQIQFSTGDLHIKLNNVEISGFADIKIMEAKFDTKSQHISLTVAIDRANLVSDYSIDGRILILPIKGDGPANITFVGGKYKYEFDYSLREHKGEQYMEIVNDHLDYTTERSYYNFENLFGGDKALGNQMNQFLNDNWKEVQQDIGPALSQTINTIITATVSGIFTIVPFSQVFLP